MALSTFVVCGALLGNRWAPRWPLPLLAVVGAIGASSALHFAELGITTLGHVPGGLPSIRFPAIAWSEFLALMPVAASCVVMILAQSAATSRGFGMRYHERVDENADIIGLSAANAAAALSGTFVVNGSPTQTAMADRVGARSQVAQLAMAGVVVWVVLLLTAPLQYLPRCVLAAIVFTIAAGMVDTAGLRVIRQQSPGDYYLALVTAATVVAIGVEHGFLLAIGLSLLRHVRHSYRPHTLKLAPDASGHWTPVPAAPGTETECGLIVYRFGADLFYANQAGFADEVRAFVARAPSPLRRFIVDAGAITDLDFTAAQTVRDLIGDLAQQNVGLVFGRTSPYLRSDMDRHGVTAVIGEGRIFSTLHEAIACARGAALQTRRNECRCRG